MDEIIKIIVVFTSLMSVGEITCSATNVSMAVSTPIPDPSTTQYPTTREVNNLTRVETIGTSLLNNTVSIFSMDTTQSSIEITVPNAPAAPSLSPGSDATNTIVVSWTASGGNDIVDYVVEWTTNSATATIVATGTSTTLTSLTPGELYSVNVKARNSAGAGAKSNNTLYRTNPNPPASFTVNTITANNEFTFSIAAPLTNVFSNYTLTTNTNGAASTININSSETTYTFTGAQPSIHTVFHLKGDSGTFVLQTESTVISVIVKPSTPITCPSECEGCIGPCSLSSTGSCDCSCIDGYFPTQLDCQPVVCKEETLVHPTLLINVTFPSLQAGFQSSSIEKCRSETVNSGKPYGTRSCLLNGTSTTPIWLTSCDRGIQNIANVTITSTVERVAVANDLEVLTSNPESLSSDDVTNTVQALDNVLDVPSITPQVSLSAVTVVSNMLNVPDDVFVASTGTNRLLTAIESVGTKVELDENGVYEAVTSNVGIAAIQPAVGTDIMRSAFRVDNLPTNSDLGFRSDQVHLFGSGAPDNVTGSISVPNSAALNNLGTYERIGFLAFSNDKLFISSNGTYDDISSVVVLSATIGQTSVTNLVDPVIVQLRTNMARDDTGNAKWLERLSIVGSSISSFFLVLTLLSMVCFCKRMNGKKPRGTVLLINLSLSLLPLNLLLIIDPSFVSSSSKSCLVVGILLHHSLQAALIWIALLVTSVPNKGIHNSLSKLKSRVWQASLCEILVMLVILSLFFNSAVVYGYSFTVLNSLQGFFVFSVVIICNKTARREIQSHITTRSSGTQQLTGNTKLRRPIKTTFQGKKGSYKPNHTDATILTQVF